MSEGNPQVELRIGGNEVKLQGSEDFISKELETILQNVDLSNSNGNTKPQDEEDSSESESRDLDDTEDDNREEDSDTDYHPAIVAVADKLSVDPAKISSHFYIEDENIHIHDSYSMPHRHALFGYCMLRTEMTGETIFDNPDTKRKLVEEERVPIDEWGGSFLHSLREENLIKNDPNSDKQRFVPFKIAPRAEQRFRDWLVDEDD